MCPYCRNEIDRFASVCGCCGRDVEPDNVTFGEIIGKVIFVGIVVVIAWAILTNS
jgi:predicted amidophosphoribosyltransferase